MKIHRRTKPPNQNPANAVDATRETTTAGFSLIELMLAMTILGLGLIMVATMFPVAWSRARSMAEFTTRENITKSAEVMLQQIAQVDGGTTAATTLRGSFAGTILYFPPATPDEVLFRIERQQRVHALYMENMTVDAPRRFIPDRVTPDDDNAFAPWILEGKDQPDEFTLGNVALLPGTGFYESAFGTAQINFEQRLYPPLPRRDFTTVDQAGLITNVDAEWEKALDQRRYTWAILHRFRHEPTDPAAFTPADYQALVAKPRDLDIFYVTLKRSRPTNRYAVQDPAAGMVPEAIEQPQGALMPARGSLQANPPAALPPANDLVLPVPWRIQVRFPGNLASANVCDGDPATPCSDTIGCPPGETCLLGEGPTGVPTEVEVNWDPNVSAPFVVDMFAKGTPFIDEANGKIYRVASRRLTGPTDDHAILTLDREVLVEDIDDGYWDNPPNGFPNQFGNLNADDEELIRTVWVFPPPVESERGEDDALIFSGNQPVIGIDVRTLTVYP